MPVTARLLRKFNEAFGQEVTGELVDWANEVDTSHRAELRELADHYFSRFDAKLEQRLAETRSDLRVEMHSGFAQLRTEMHSGFAQLRTEMHAEFAAAKSEMIKYMFAFWAGSAITTVATVWGVAGLIR